MYCSVGNNVLKWSIMLIKLEKLGYGNYQANVLNYGRMVLIEPGKL